MYELPFMTYTDAQIKEEMYHFLNQLAMVEWLEECHRVLILKYLDVVSREKSK